MAMAERFSPDWCIHPGETLQEILEDDQMTYADLAGRTGYSELHIKQVCLGNWPITAEMAVRLEEALGEPSAEFWASAQWHYDLHIARDHGSR